MQEFKILGSDSDYDELESIFKRDGVSYQRFEMMYRGADIPSQEVIMVAVSTAASIQAICSAIIAVYKNRKKIFYTDGHGKTRLENYKPDEIAKILPKIKALYIEDSDDAA